MAKSSPKPRRTQAQSDAALKRQRERIARAQSQVLQAQASEKRIEAEAQKILKARLLAVEKQEAQVRADRYFKDMQGAGLGTQSAQGKATTSRTTREAQQKQQASKTAGSAKRGKPTA